MLNRIVNYFIPDDIKVTPDLNRRYTLVVIIILLTALFDLNYAGITILIGMKEGEAIMFFTFVIHFLLLSFIRMRWSLLVITNIYLFFGVLAINVCIYYSGGFESPVLPWLASTPIVAMMMAGKKTGIVWLIINSVTVVFFSILGKRQYPFPRSYDKDWENFFYTNCYTGIVLIIFFVALTFENGKNSALKKLAQKSLLLAEEKKKTALNNISQEIHDNVGQVLSIIKMNLHLMDIYKGKGEELQLKDSVDLLGGAIQDLRNLSHEIYSNPVLEKNLVEVLKKELDTLSGMGLFAVSFKVNGICRSLDSQTEFILSRIVKEAINNIIKHAKATHIGIDLQYEPEQLTMVLKDNGTGMDIDNMNGLGQGIKSMKSRATLLGADFHIDSPPEGGTCITVRVPDKSVQYFQ